MVGSNPNAIFDISVLSKQQGFHFKNQTKIFVDVNWIFWEACFSVNIRNI